MLTLSNGLVELAGRVVARGDVERSRQDQAQPSEETALRGACVNSVSPEPLACRHTRSRRARGTAYKGDVDGRTVAVAGGELPNT